MLDTDRPEVHTVPTGAPRRWSRKASPFTPRKTKHRRPRSTSKSRARLSLVLLLYFLGIIAVITLAPFRFAIPSAFHVLGGGNWFDIVANVLLFVPLGFLYPLTRPGDEPSPLEVLVIGCLLSASIETAQLFERDRYTSFMDVVTNTAGAGVGALLLGAVNQRIRINARLVGRLSLEIPLIGLIYLLIPLLVVASLSALDNPLQTVSLLPLGLLGARLMASVQEHHFGPAEVFKDRAIALVAAGWMALGAFPVVLRHPLVGVGLVGLVALATFHESSTPVVHGLKERRFEADVLRSAVPYVAVYFIATVLLPLAFGTTSWHVELGLTGSGDDLSLQMIRLLEPVASLTVLGYMLAEARGRRELRFRAIAARVVAECALVAVGIEVSRGFQPDAGASVIQLGLMIGAGLLGAGIYHNQREHVRWILIHRPPTPAVGMSAVR